MTFRKNQIGWVNISHVIFNGGGLNFTKFVCSTRYQKQVIRRPKSDWGKLEREG